MLNLNDLNKALIKPIVDARDSITGGNVIWSGLPVIPNAIAYEPDGQQSFVATYNLPSGAPVVEVGGNQDFTGVYQIDIVSPIGQGESDLLTKATELLSLYEVGTTLSHNDAIADISEISYTRVIKYGGFAKIAVSINYSSFN